MIFNPNKTIKMKKIYLTMLVMILGVITCQAKKKPDFTVQDFAKYNIDDFDGVSDNVADFISAALNIKTNFGLDTHGYIGQTTIIECPGMSKQDIYVQARLWLEDFCANDKKAELKLDGSLGSTLIARKRLLDIADNKGEFAQAFGLELKKKNTNGRKINILVNIQIDVKDERCRLATTIEDYGVATYQSKVNAGGIGAAIATGGITGLIGAAIGTAVGVAMSTETIDSAKPAYHFPFIEYMPEEGEKEKDIEKGRKKFKEYEEPLFSTAYVYSFLITQIIHDKVVDKITSSPSFGNNNDW